MKPTDASSNVLVPSPAFDERPAPPIELLTSANRPCEVDRRLYLYILSGHCRNTGGCWLMSSIRQHFLISRQCLFGFDSPVPKGF